jgi:hypothetical protein
LPAGGETDPGVVRFIARRGIGGAIARHEHRCAMSTIILIILIILVIGALPSWPYSTGWGYYPSSGLGLLFIVVAVLLLLGYR